ncbi:hypothetical protein CG51_01435 [Haematobacter missouriensis]|uniref:Methionine synthase I n=1 Tax=Haematobacter missouriensis TaxID=366616 RepID=A0A212AJU8_9RHOB|nr:holin family protein [Haematobacter missouriensis]KFI32606.1 hypothetical protein CG51_01435 [Haematobacter missouriensis]OWJ76722.1 methionine synthase I [Haematobacter missouriensis]OWJ81780.1 methionine synthase I [Haematobacter missouriensis]
MALTPRAGLRAVEALGAAAALFGQIATRAAERGEDVLLRKSGELSRYDRIVDGLNRLPRPFLALGTIGLFIHAMTDPDAFARRMTGLAAVPEPLWWLLGAVVSFHFGAREAHYLRSSRPAPPSDDG